METEIVRHKLLKYGNMNLSEMTGQLENLKNRATKESRLL